nr:MAG TPA: minor capsid protein [Bacteriophage sp.]
MEQSSRAAYRAAGKRIRQQVADYEHIGIAELAEIHRLLDSELKQLEQVQNRLLHDGMLAAAAAAALGWRGRRREPEAERLLVRHLLDTPQKDGLNLSARLWRIHAGAARDLKSVVDVAVQRGWDAEHALQRTLNITPELKQALDEAGAGAVARRLEAGLLANPGNAAMKFRRVLRTEINRAHGERYKQLARADENVVGLRFMLSPRHPRVDICDEHAAADLYGLGQGVYPVDECPWPAHPNTFSYTEAVYRDEIGSLNPTVEKVQTEIAAEADGLLEWAAAIEPVITGDLQRMAAAVQARMAGLDYRFKGRESLIRKIESKTWRRDVTPARAAANITDVLRYTVLLDSESFVSQYWQLQEQLAASGYQTNKVSNTWRKNAVYKGINTTIIKNGQVFELQFHTEQSFNLKNNELHKLYEEAREISTSTERRAELQRQMVELSRQIPTPPGISTIQTKAGIR